MFEQYVRMRSGSRSLICAEVLIFFGKFLTIGFEASPEPGIALISVKANFVNF